MRAWEALYNRPILRKRVDVLEKATRLNQRGINFDDIAKIADGNKLNGNSSTPALIDVFDNLEEFSRFQNRTGFYDVIDQLALGGPKHIGANWVMKYSGKGPLKNVHPAEIIFEYNPGLSGYPINRVIDVLQGGTFNPTKYFECKSVLPSSVVTQSNIRQLEFDLDYVANLNKIEWAFDGAKLPANYDFTSFINSVNNVSPSAIENILGRPGTIQDLRSELLNRSSEIFKIYNLD